MPAEDYEYDGIPLSQMEGLDDDVLKMLARKSLTGLGWVAETLDKPGRAIRGTLAGRPEELLNLVPLSDTFGLTDPTKSVSGRDLNRMAGLAGEEDNWGNWFGGLATEIVTDPLNFITLGTKSTLTKLGREAAKTGLEKTALERIAAGQSGMVGLRTPWLTDMVGLTNGRMPLMTGDYGKYFAGQVYDDAAALVNKVPGGKFVTDATTQAFDRGRAFVRSTFIPGGAEYTMDPRIVNPMYDVSMGAKEDVLNHTLPQRMDLYDQTKQAYDYLRGIGVPPQEAEGIIGRYTKTAAEQVDPALLGEDILARFATDAGMNPAEVVAGLKNITDQIGGNRTLYDVGRDKMIEVGIDVGDKGNLWDHPYSFRQSQTAGVSKSGPKKSRTLPEDILFGGTAQLDELATKSPVAGLATAPVPAGMSAIERRKFIKDQNKAFKDKFTQDVIAARDAKWKPVVATTNDAVQPVAEAAANPLNKSVRTVGRGGKTYETALLNKAGREAMTADKFAELIDGKNIASPDVLKVLSEVAPQLDDDAFRVLMETLPSQLDELQPSQLSKIAESIGAKGADPILGETAADNILMRLAEARKATPVEEAVSQAAKEVGVAPKPVAPELPYPKQLTDENIRKQAGKLAKWLNHVDQDVVKSGKGYFRNDPLGLADTYIHNAAGEVGKAKGALESIAREAIMDKAVTSSGTTVADAASAALRDNPGGFVSVKNALEQIGLSGKSVIDGTAGKVMERGGARTLLDMMASKGKGVATDRVADIDKQLAQWFIPADMVPLLKREIKGPGYEAKYGLGEGIEKATSAIRAWMTLPWPAFHTRNTWEGFLQQGMSAGIDRQALKDSWDYIAGALKDPKQINEMGEFAKEAWSTRAAFRHQMGEMLGESVVGKAGAATPWVDQTSKGRTDILKNFLGDFAPDKVAAKGQTYATLDPKTSAIIQQGSDLSGMSDDLQRFSNFVALRRQGYKPNVAAKMTTEAHLDYSALTPTERKIRQLVPYYSFSRRNLTRLGTQAQDPGPLASMVRVATNASGESSIPGYVGQGGAIPIPGGEEGSQRYLSGLGLPVEDEMFSALSTLLSGHPVDAISRAGQTLNPLIKAPIAFMTGRNMFSGRRLDEAAPGGLAAYLPGGNYTAEALSATPFGRLLTTSNAVVSGRDENPLLKLMTGIRTTDVDPVLAAQQASRDQVAKMLRGTGMVSTSESIYARPEYSDPDTQPDQLTALLQLMNGIRKRGTELRQERLP